MASKLLEEYYYYRRHHLSSFHSQNIDSDYLKLTGKMKKKQKFHITQLFCKKVLYENTEFHPQVLFGTSGANSMHALKRTTSFSVDFL